MKWLINILLWVLVGTAAGDPVEQVQVALDAFIEAKHQHIPEHSGKVIGTELCDQFEAALDGLTADEVEKVPPVQRALLQHALWAQFDWTAGLQPVDWNEDTQLDETARRRLQQKLVNSIRALALSSEQIGKLADPYRATVQQEDLAAPEFADPAKSFAPYLPRGLFDSKSGWVEVHRLRHSLTAKFHGDKVAWRAAFHVLIEVPGGRENTLRYLKTLSEFQDHWVTPVPERKYLHMTLPNGGIHNVNAHVNPATPQFPAGTRFALVERAVLIDQAGKLVSSPLTLGLQLRTYIRVEGKLPLDRSSRAVAEWVITDEGRELRPVTSEEVFADFPRHKNKKHKATPRLQTCVACHSGWGIHSVNTRAQLFEPRSLTAPQLTPVSDSATVAQETLRAKKRAYAWGLLQGLWR